MWGVFDRLGACCCMTSWMACMRKSPKGLLALNTLAISGRHAYRLLADQQKVCVQAVHSLSPLRRVLQGLEGSGRSVPLHNWLRRVLQ